MYLLRQPIFLILAELLSLTLLCADATAGALHRNCCANTCGRFYVGAFGGGGRTVHNRFTQTGTALFPLEEGGPLFVNAAGSSRHRSAAIGGGHIGYAWQEWQIIPSWPVSPAVELEGYYLGSTQHRGLAFSPSFRIPEHAFIDSFPTNAGVLLANATLNFNVPCWNMIHPYIGGGVGAAFLSVSWAHSEQIAPAEVGVNHFNSNPHDSDWVLAVQGKAGLSVDLSANCRVFAEYRFLRLSPSHFTLGSTVYSNHAPTTKWKVHFDNQNYNLGVAGVEFSI